jgi:hypothetical protein
MWESISAFFGKSKIEACAERISDPVERLRYLRTAAPRRTASTRGNYTTWCLASCVALLVLPQGSGFVTHRSIRLGLPTENPASSPGAGPQIVWPVERRQEYEVYSNGLRIEDDFAVANQPRSYRLISRLNPQDLGPERTVPSGIVFHTTESDQAPFEEGQNRTLRRIGQELLLYVRQKRAYHFLIDRFGRVHRVVAESDVANHAGHSVWADSRWLYFGLNQSFLGVAFEAQMQRTNEPVNEAQVHAAKVLVEMLRGKYNIPAENCVTHAQVSVNPENMRIGWHTDWGALFPFAGVGLPNNYQQPSPLIYLFGFEYDELYRNATGADLGRALEISEQSIRETAAHSGVTESEYRKSLKKKYRELAAFSRSERVEENK